MSNNALSLLRPDEICVIVMHDGRQREATWKPEQQAFECEGDLIPADTVYEWWPAGVKF